MEIFQLSYRQRRKKLRRKFARLLLVVGVLLLVLSSTLYSYLAIKKPLPHPRVNYLPLSVAATNFVALGWPVDAYAAAGSLEEGVLAKSNELEYPAPTASIAKVVTALAILEKKPILPGTAGETITLNTSDVDIYHKYLSAGGSVIAVALGEQLSERQAIEAMMLPSANNIADSMAVWAFGSVENYVAYATTLLKSWGLTQTTVVDASGFSPSTVSTPSDLVIIGIRALSNSVLASIVSEQSAVLPVTGTINNTNQLLGQNNIVGIKTGHTSEAGNCLLFAARIMIAPDHIATTVIAVMGSPSLQKLYEDSSTLLTEVVKDFGAITVIKAGETVAEIKTAWGTATMVNLTSDLTHYGWKGNISKPLVSIGSIELPAVENKTVGTIAITSGLKNTSVPLKTESRLRGPSLAWRLTHFF